MLRNLIPLTCAVVIACGTTACSSADPEPGPEVTFGPLLEILGDSVPGASLLGAQPVEFLVCAADEMPAALRFRAEWRAEEHGSELSTIIDVSPLGALERASMSDRLIEPALDHSGAIYLDESGTTAASLRQRHPGVHQVRVGVDRRILFSQEISSIK